MEEDKIIRALGILTEKPEAVSEIARLLRPTFPHSETIFQWFIQVNPTLGARPVDVVKLDSERVISIAHEIGGEE